MARKSRKESIRVLNAGGDLPIGGQTTVQESKQTYRAIGYARLSIAETRDRKDNEALQNQKAFLREYVQKKTDLLLVGLCEDNGETGTNFHRPGFEHMMELIRSGKANCIVVKDLSRFGRDYVEAGNYLDHVFPLIGVRFISISDGYDSADAATVDCLTVALKNLVNQMYSMDISRKAGSVLREKMRRGEFIGGFAAYGYIKDPSDRHHLIVDPEAAAVVREIFRQKLSGTNSRAIVRWLNETGILSPGCYRYQKGIICDKKFEQPRPWIYQTVADILRNQVYTGDLVQGRRRSEFFAGKADRALPQEDWCIVANTHEPIVSREDYEAVQAIMADTAAHYHARQGKYAYLGNSENIWKGLIFCGDCGRPLIRHRTVIRGKRNHYTFFCPGYSTHFASSVCSQKYLREDVLRNVVVHTVLNEVRQAADTTALMERHIAANRKQIEMLTAEIAQLGGNLSKAEARKRETMEDYLNGLLPRSEYEQFSTVCDTETDRLKQQICLLKDKRQRQTEMLTQSNPWLKTFGKLDVGSVLDGEMVHALIQRINVYDHDRLEVILSWRDERELLLMAVSEEDAE